MNDQPGATKWIGMDVERLEDPPLVTGRGRFAGGESTDDPDQCLAHGYGDAKFDARMGAPAQ